MKHSGLGIRNFYAWALEDRRAPGRQPRRRRGIRNFHAWALGDLVDNRNRGIFAEWLVGKALQIIDDGDVRKTWDAYDLLYGNVKIEVKASGLSQGRNVDTRSNPRFDVRPRKWTWLESEEQWIENDPPARPADVYVFCLHTSEVATNENVANPHCWQFWVIPTSKLDELDDQLNQRKSVGLATLDRLTDWTRWSDIKAGVDGCVQEVTRRGGHLWCLCRQRLRSESGRTTCTC